HHLPFQNHWAKSQGCSGLLGGRLAYGQCDVDGHRARLLHVHLYWPVLVARAISIGTSANSGISSTIVDIAGSSGATSKTIACRSFTGSVVLRAPLRNKARTTSSNETWNASSALPAMAVVVCGTITRKKVRIGLPPRLAEA